MSPRKGSVSCEQTSKMRVYLCAPTLVGPKPRTGSAGSKQGVCKVGGVGFEARAKAGQGKLSLPGQDAHLAFRAVDSQRIT